MDRREFIKKAGSGLLVSAVASNTFIGCTKQSRRPNIIFIMSDDHALQAISAYGNNLNKTPNIDRIAEEGILFENCFCTNSICAPSRATILTGKYSHINGLIDNTVSFDGSQMTFPKLLKRSGYQTSMIGKWHLKSDPTGFDYWNILPGQGHYYNPNFIENGKRKRIQGYVTDIITDKAINWLDKRDRSNPFCMMLQHKAPHRNWMPAPEYLNQYDDRTFPIPDNFFDDYEGRIAAEEQELKIGEDMLMAYDLKIPPSDAKKYESEQMYKRDKESWKYIFKRMNENQKNMWEKAYKEDNQDFLQKDLKGKELEKWKYQRYIKDYLRCISSVDKNIGRLFEYLEANDLLENTLLIYTSDQGFYLGEHGWFDKRFMYEESLHMPLMIRYPKEIKPNTNTDELVNNTDFAPTFLDYAGINIPDDMQGRSFRNIMQGKVPDDWRDATYYHYFEYPGAHGVKRHYGIRTKRYKLIHFYHDIDQWELYDLKNDPKEMNNLYGIDKFDELVKNLKKQLQQLRVKYNDTDVEKYLPQEKVKVDHLAKGREVKLKNKYSSKYPAGGPNALTNGWKAPDNKYALHGLKVWQGYEVKDLVATVDLEEIVNFDNISIGMLHNTSSWIFAPSRVEFFISNDGDNFKKIGQSKIPIKLSNRSMQRVPYSINKKGMKARYVKVIARNQGKCPDWHKGGGGNAWLFADEIIVR